MLRRRHLTSEARAARAWLLQVLPADSSLRQSVQRRMSSDEIIALQRLIADLHFLRAESTGEALPTYLAPPVDERAEWLRNHDRRKAAGMLKSAPAPVLAALGLTG